VHLQIGALSRATTAATTATARAEESLEQFLRINLLLVTREVEGTVTAREAAKAFESSKGVAATTSSAKS